MIRTRHLLAIGLAATLVAACVRAAPSAMLSDRYALREVTALPTPRTTGAMSLEEAIAQRRSGREFRSDLLPLWLLGQLLWAAQGITGPGGKRAAPSAGALYPLELYVVEPAAILHYLPAGHRVERRSDVDRRPELEAAAFGQDFVGSAPVVVVIVAVVERTRRRYGAVAADLVNREAGHAAQNLLLEATAHGLAAVPVGGLDPRAVEVALALPPGHEAVYMIPVGYPAGSG
ncbi:MAG TPA: SagB/ThcOx family dehydrogenase [Acidimicrobiales bacterium]|nr:SagB/ThcOx family dehydrogenase [Acidimicrobiales bacterium]